MDLETIMREDNATVVDVRTPQEYNGGHVAGSVNIPMHEIPHRIEELKNMKMPLILCCASGGRSGQAYQYLIQHGITCYNGGSWLNVNYLQSRVAG